MVGREVDVAAARRARTRELGEPVLELDDLWARGDRGGDALRGVVARRARRRDRRDRGRRGQRPARARRDDRPACARARRRGIASAGSALRGGDPREAIRAGVAHVPEDRLHTGVAPSLSIASNVVLKSYRGRAARHAGRCCGCGAIRDARRAADPTRYDVRGAGPELPARQLSGGNLQKVVLAPRVLGRPARARRRVADARPRRRARSRPCTRYLREAAAEGVGVLLISEDLDEILALADRDRVMYEGAIVGEVDADDGERRGDRPADGGRARPLIRDRAAARQPRWLLVRRAGRLARRRVRR